jgi:signal transduction histidine kinase
VFSKFNNNISSLFSLLSTAAAGTQKQREREREREKKREGVRFFTSLFSF